MRFRRCGRWLHAEGWFHAPGEACFDPALLPGGRAFPGDHGPALRWALSEASGGGQARKASAGLHRRRGGCWESGSEGGQAGCGGGGVDRQVGGAPLNRRSLLLRPSSTPITHHWSLCPAVPVGSVRGHEGPSGMGSLGFRGGPEGLDHRRPSGRAEGPTLLAPAPSLTRATPGAVPRAPSSRCPWGPAQACAPLAKLGALQRVHHSPGHHPGCRMGSRAPGIPEGEALVGPRAPKASVCPLPAPSISWVTGRTWEGDGVRETRRPRQLALHRVWVYVRQAAGAEEHVTWARGPGHSQPLCHWRGRRLL